MEGVTLDGLGAITISGGGDKLFPIEREFRVFGHYALVLVWDGSGLYEDLHGQSISIDQGDLILVFPDLGHRYGPGAGQIWRELYLVFDGPVFKLWEDAGLLCQDKPVWRLSAVDVWKARFESILESALPRWSAVPPHDRNRRLREVCRLQQFLADAAPMQQAPRIGRSEYRWVQRAIAALETSGDPCAAARIVGLSHAHFRRRFTRGIGTSPVRYLARKQIEEACRLMQETDLRDYEIAERTGFYDPYHFSRRFKQISGQTPREYRMSLP